jgi:putative transposase
MSRLARVVIPGLPHHVTQRGNRREQVFFGDGDYRYYLKLIASAARTAGAEIWSYCLMPNHVHFLMVPSTPDSLRATFADAHRRYTSFVNARRDQTGHLWQGRFASVVMDERHLLAALRYVALNPVRAGLVERAIDWRWSSARAHVSGCDDGVVRVEPALGRTGDFTAFLGEEQDDAAVTALRDSNVSGRPVGDATWLAELEVRVGRSFARVKPGPKPAIRIR